MRTHYDTLFLTPAANQKLIERAYRTLSQEYHPDHNPEIDREKYTQLQTELNKAYEVLRDPEKRERYDESLRHTPKEQFKESTKVNDALNAKESTSNNKDDKQWYEDTWLMASIGGLIAMFIKKYFF